MDGFIYIDDIQLAQSVEEVIIISVVSLVSSLPALLLEVGLYVSVGQPVEEQVRSQLLVLVARHVGLSCLDLAEAQCCQLQ